MVFAQAAPLFLAAAAVCFFAYNWATMPVFAKFGLIGSLMLGSAAVALRRGFDSMAGSLGLLACGLFVGPLLAVFGQTYQTGADAWKLFRAWFLFLIPLAFVGRQNGLWFALWVIGNIWAALYLMDLTHFSHNFNDGLTISLYIAAGQAVALLLWETAALWLAGPERSFLQGRWLPRIMALPPMALLTCTLATYQLFSRAFGFGAGSAHLHLSLYLLILLCGALYYTRKKRDPLMIAYGLMSLLALAAMFPLTNLSTGLSSLGDALIGRLFLVVLILSGGAAASVKILLRYNKSAIPSEAASGSDKWDDVRSREENAPPPDPADVPVHSPASSSSEGDEPLSLSSAYSPRLMRFALSGKFLAEKATPETDTSDAATWPARVLAGLAAWIAAPFLMALIGLMFSGTFETNGFIFLLLLVMAAGACLSHQPGGVFKDQTALCLALTGTLGAGGLFAATYNSLMYSYMPQVLLLAVGCCFVKNTVYRFFASAIGFPLLTFSLLVGSASVSLLYGYRSSDLPTALPPVSVALFTLFCLALAHVRTTPPGGQWLGKLASPRWQSMLAGCHVALLLMAAVPLTGRFTPFDMIGLGASAGLAYLVFRLSGPLALSRARQALFYGLCIAVAAVSWKLPWFGTGLFALALARQAVSMPLTGLAVIFLATCVNLEYYSQSTSLLNKSISLACVGLFLLAAAVALHKLLLADMRRDKPSVPMSPRSGRSSTAPTDQPSASPSRFRPSRGHIVIVCLALFFPLFFWSVLQKERLLSSGDSVILALRPVDPRSLMQGDYMVLRFALEDDIRSALSELRAEDKVRAKGAAVLEEGPDKVFHFKRLEDGSPLAGTEKLLIFRGREHNIQVSSGSFFFQEGHGQAYEKARFALLRVDSGGNSLITRLLDEKLAVIQPEQNAAP